MALPSYVVWFRGKPACPCLAEWLPVFEAELLRRNVIRESIDIAQLIGSAAASANTHSTGGAFDIWQHDPVTVWVARQMGADATWARTTGSFANNRHTHGVLTGCPHNSAARYQIDEVRAGGDGLVGNTPDPGPRPLSGRTWREGIAWAKQQQEETMTPAQEKKLDAVAADVAAIHKRLDNFRDRDTANRERVQRLIAMARDDKADRTAMLAELKTLESTLRDDE